MHDEDLPICTACGSQFDDEGGKAPTRCKICDDPRQFVPPSGQSWTTLKEIRSKHENKWAQDAHDSRIWYFWTEPKFAIGQRAFLLLTPHGNIMWDMIALLSASTITQIKSLGGLHAIVISHPHYYTTYASWLTAFPDAVLHIASDDKQWLCRQPERSMIVCSVVGLQGYKEEVVPGVEIVKTGGHFPGSLVLWWEGRLFLADSIMTVPSGLTPHPRPPGQTTYTFMWSIPNMIPLPPSEIQKVWDAVKGLEFDTSFGAFVGMDVRDKDLKGRMLESVKIQIEGEGWDPEEVFREDA